LNRLAAFFCCTAAIGFVSQIRVMALGAFPDFSRFDSRSRPTKSYASHPVVRGIPFGASKTPAEAFHRRWAWLDQPLRRAKREELSL
jgi:hypothetical protein